MNKKLIALAVAGALGAPLVASAQGTGVTLFGRVGAEYSSTEVDSATSYRQETVGDNAGVSRWGLLIKEDLGNGLTANGRIEYFFRAGNGVADGAREQWVGLSSKTWGSVQFGRVQSVLKDFAGGAYLDPFITTNLQARGSGGAMYTPANGFGVGAFVDHAIRYTSPTFGGGFSAAVLLSPADATQAQGSTGTLANVGGNVGGKGGSNNYQVGLKYKFGTAGEVFGGYSQDDANDNQAAAGGDDEQVWRLGGAWNFGNFRIAGQYEDIRDALAGNGGATCGGGASANGGGDVGITTAQCNTAINTNGDGDIWFLTAQYKLGKTTLVLQGGQTDADEVRNAAGVLTIAEREATNITLGAIYNFSKRTKVFGGYQKVNIDSSTVAAGVATPTAIEPDRSTWTIGMHHFF